jgi:hypothetical protein
MTISPSNISVVSSRQEECGKPVGQMLRDPANEAVWIVRTQKNEQYWINVILVHIPYLFDIQL